MTSFAKEIIPVNLEDEMKQSYLDYAMSVIVGRALPDVRDGLKPVHRRVLYAMHELGNDWNKPYKKSARIVGDTIGKLHPHGDVAVYDTIVRMAQHFSLRYTLIDGQGNFGCFTGDTRIKLADGTEKSFAELAQLPPDQVFYVYAVNRYGRIVIAEGRYSRITRPGAALLELTLDNGETIRCTPDHRFMLRDGSYKEAKDLTPEDSLMPGVFDTAPIKPGLNHYLRVLQPDSGQYEFVHQLADEFNARKGIAAQMSGAFVRHHRNFNRWDNSPPNIQRLGFLEHLHIHAAQIKELWKDPEFREAQKHGVRRFYAENPEVLEQRRRRFIRQNQDEDFRRQNGPRMADGLKRHFSERPQAREAISARMQALWQDEEYRERMSEALSGIEKRPLSDEEKARVAAIISEKSKAMWGDDAKRVEIVEAISRAMADPGIRAKISRAVRRHWENPEYRAKFPSGHFSRMAEAVWDKPETREMHRDKISRQRQDAEFRTAQRQGVQRSNARRIQDNPSMMREISDKAVLALRESWRDPNHRSQVIRRKIAGYVYGLLKAFPEQDFTPELYESQRHQNWIPHIGKAVEYFGDFNTLADAGRHYNHRIVAKREPAETADTYDITVDEHHNFLLAANVFVHNSVDGDPPAAMRYTEVRMARIAHELLADLDKETVDFIPNYDESEREPTVLPTRIPNLLINGSAGIAVGMATNIPPHNLGEVIDACLHLIEQPETSIQDLMRYVPGPDFPTFGLINGAGGIREAYLTGRGRIYLRARCEFEEDGHRTSIVVHELPYQVNKAKLQEKIAELAKEGRLGGISGLRDESDKDGMRLVIELKRGESAEVVLNNLYQLTAMQTVFGINMVALIDGRPRCLNLKEFLAAFIDHRREVVTRRTLFDLRKARERAHILEGLAVALANIDAVIELIKTSPSPAVAKERLLEPVWRPGVVMELLARAEDAIRSRPETLPALFGLGDQGYRLSPEQAQAILELRLHRLTGLEQDKIIAEYREILAKIDEFLAILGSDIRLMEVIREELAAIREQFADPRRTRIIEDHLDLSRADLITEEDMVVTVSHEGYVKSQPLTAYRAQRRGGRGKAAATTKEEDFIEKLIVANTHDTILCFSSVGKVYWLKVYELPVASRTSRGKPFVNLLPLEEGERINAILPIREFDEGHFIFMATASGIVKKVALKEFERPRSLGKIAIDLRQDDRLVDVAITDGQQHVMLFSDAGKAVCFDEDDVRVMGRGAAGVRGMALGDDQKIIALIIGTEGSVLNITEKGYGKRTDIADFPRHRRGGQGVIAIQTHERNGAVVGAVLVNESDELMLITDGGTLVRTRVEEIRELGRNTQGVMVIRLNPGEKVVGVDRIPMLEGESDDIAETGEETAGTDPTEINPINQEGESDGEGV
nr:DNA gyrase subunit A [Methylomagnum ishizawai]